MKKWHFLCIVFLITGLCFIEPATAGVGDLKEGLSKSSIDRETSASKKVENIRKYLTEQEKKDLKKWGYDEKTWGSLIGVYDTGFDIYNDTPAFDNFSGQLISKGGTCLGMCWLVKYYFENVTFEENGQTDIKEILAAIANVRKITIHGFKNFREFSKKDVEKMKKIMEVAHLNNFNPETIIQALPGAQKMLPPDGERNALLNNLSVGKIAMIAIYHSRPLKIGDITVLYKPENGHAIMAYKAIRFTGKVIFYIYDPNVIYDNGNHSNYALLFNGEKFELFPASYKNWYSNWYPDGPTVVSTNSMIELIKEKIARKASEVLKNIIGAARDFITSAADAVQNATRDAWNTVTDVATTIGSGVRNTFERAAAWLGSKFSFSW